MSPDLSILKDNRDALLLAEIAAWLHDMGKCSDGFLKENGMGFDAKCNGNPRVNPHKAVFSPEELKKLPYWKKLSPNRGQPSRKEEAEHDTALWRTLDDLQIDKNKIDKKIEIDHLNYKSNLRELILWGRPLVSDNFKTKNNRKGFKEILNDAAYLAAYLGRSHQASHIEKEEGGEGQQKDIFISSPFGYEKNILSNLNGKLEESLNTIFSNQKRNDRIKGMEKSFQLALGDTRRPVNEITLWDWSSIVAALYKSALAGALLGNKPEPNDLKWRLLAIRIDSEKILGNVSKIPALLARKKWITDGLDEVKKLIEEEYPMGNEVYRDENGSIFVVPDIPNLLNIKDGNQSLQDMISEKLGFDGEVVITPSLSDSWWGQNPSGKPDSTKDEIPPIGDILKKPLHSPPDPNKVKEWWHGVSDTEIDTVSWLRPQGPTERGFQRKASDYWTERATGRAEEWLGKLDKTIWVDEVEDANGRICLITGRLEISEWLSSDGHVKTLLVKPPNNNGGKEKTPSFARLRRIWETTKTFWEDVEMDFKETVASIDGRLKINGEFKPENENNNLSDNNAYEAELNEARFSVFYTKNNEFTIIENLRRLAKKFGDSLKEAPDFNETIKYIENNLNGKTLKIYDPDGKNRGKPIGSFKISRVDEDKSTSYIPFIPILSEPSIFMAIVPADRGLEIAKHIKEKYEKEMGKVRNRLPITIGMVFAKSHTPLAALMDAGRRMLKIPNEEEEWVLNSDAEDCNKDCILNFGNGITWRVPVKMGDGVTNDIWYPYFYVNGTPANRSMAFKGSKEWLVHVKELKKGDKVKITPSKFDFEFLDTASRRFELSYENGKRRGITKSERPYLLEELEDFIRLWDTVSDGLARSQIKNIIGLIEAKREEWLPEEGNDVFGKFVHNVLHNAKWKGGTPTNIGELEKAAISGKLKDIVELNMDILKVRNKEEKEQEVFE